MGVFDSLWISITYLTEYSLFLPKNKYLKISEEVDLNVLFDPGFFPCIC